MSELLALNDANCKSNLIAKWICTGQHDQANRKTSKANERENSSSYMRLGASGPSRGNEKGTEAIDRPADG